MVFGALWSTLGVWSLKGRPHNNALSVVVLHTATKLLWTSNNIVYWANHFFFVVGEAQLQGNGLLRIRECKDSEIFEANVAGEIGPKQNGTGEIGLKISSPSSPRGYDGCGLHPSRKGDVHQRGYDSKIRMIPRQPPLCCKMYEEFT
ncbi:hypothetical protein OUZ56_003512 [Daphnia magna]|uniref:Uncharacterized protein n=1 Tax=Daphnia magna TaxID=35525 RepID=A0ABR0A8X8_9CRUS|nr:hypothetical protein OUZ56_003512 [Daphnia magna]